MDMRCWQCGVEPTGVTDVTGLGSAGREYLPTGWPAADHEHAVRPPTPGELLAGADRAREERLRIWAA